MILQIRVCFFERFEYQIRFTLSSPRERYMVSKRHICQKCLNKQERIEIKAIIQIIWLRKKSNLVTNRWFLAQILFKRLYLFWVLLSYHFKDYPAIPGSSTSPCGNLQFSIVINEKYVLHFLYTIYMYQYQNRFAQTLK